MPRRGADLPSASLLHTLATDLLRQGTYIGVNQILLGHADLGTTAIYTSVVDQLTGKAVFRVPSDRTKRV